MTFCFRCEFCGTSVETQEREPAPLCCHELSDVCGEGLGVPMLRDYRAEGFGLGSGVKVSRDGLVSDQARIFLPTNEEFAGPSDPDGTKGMRSWRESHAPKADNKNPYWPGKVERTVF